MPRPPCSALAPRIAALAARDRDTLLLYAWGDLTYEQIAVGAGDPGRDGALATEPRAPQAVAAGHQPDHRQHLDEGGGSRWTSWIACVSSAQTSSSRDEQLFARPAGGAARSRCRTPPPRRRARLWIGIGGIGGLVAAGAGDDGDRHRPVRTARRGGRGRHTAAVGPGGDGHAEPAQPSPTPDPAPIVAPVTAASVLEQAAALASTSAGSSLADGGYLRIESTTEQLVLYAADAEQSPYNASRENATAAWVAAGHVLDLHPRGPLGRVGAGVPAREADHRAVGTDAEPLAAHWLDMTLDEVIVNRYPGRPRGPRGSRRYPDLRVGRVLRPDAPRPAGAARLEPGADDRGQRRGRRRGRRDGADPGSRAERGTARPARRDVPRARPRAGGRDPVRRRRPHDARVPTSTRTSRASGP